MVLVFFTHTHTQSALQYLGTQEVNSARGDAEIADRLQELRSLFKNVVKHLPKVTVTLQIAGITVWDEKSKVIILVAQLICKFDNFGY